MQKNSFEVSVLIQNKPAREYSHHDRTYIEGRCNSEFDLLLRNNSSDTVEAVISVDGLDVLDGKSASTKKDGYLIQPYSSFKLEGWRLDNKEVAHFFFASQSDSYAASQDKPRNIGVIGVAFFKPKKAITYPWNGVVWYSQFPNYYQNQQSNKYVYPNPIITCGGRLDSINPSIYNSQIQCNAAMPAAAPSSSNASGILRSVTPQSLNITETSCNANVSSVNASGTSASDANVSGENNMSQEKGLSQGLGAGFGRRTESAVVNVSFTRASETPDEVLEIRYNDRPNLEKLGIKVAQPIPEELAVRETAKPFEDLNNACKPPANWRG
jgi:hypothetical protein